MSHVASVCTPCCMLMQVVGSCCAKVETGQTLNQQLPTFLLSSDRRRVAQQCWIQLHSSSNIVGNCTFPLPCIWANDIPTYIYSWRIKKVPPFLAEPPPKGRYSESPSPSPGEPMIITRETSQFQQLIHSLGGRKFVYQEKRNQSLIIGYGLKLPYLVYNCLFS